MADTESFRDRLLKGDLEKALGEPVKLSEEEQKKIKEVFCSLHGALDETEEMILHLNRDEAYRRTQILMTQIKQAYRRFEAQPGETPFSDQGPEFREVKSRRGEQGDQVVEDGPELNEGETPSLSGQEAAEPKVKPTEEEFGAWLEDLPEKAKQLAAGLECVQFFRNPPEGADRMDAICPECTAEELLRCARREDPDYTDPSTEIINANLRG